MRLLWFCEGDTLCTRKGRDDLNDVEKMGNKGAETGKDDDDDDEVKGK